MLLSASGLAQAVSIVAAAYPGEFPRGADVDGLRSMCVARLRVAVGAGIWRANHKTLGAWAERAYPEGHLIDNNEGAAAA